MKRFSRKQLPKKDKNLRKLKVYEKKAKKKNPRAQENKVLKTWDSGLKIIKRFEP